MRAQTLKGAAGVRARTEVMGSYRRFATIDPRLPERLLPDGWPRRQARDVFTAVYDELASVAEQHVRSIAAAHSTGSPPEIHANTVADLLAGRRMQGLA